MFPTPFISGIGLCTPLGKCAASTWGGICSGRFITDHARAPLVESAGQPRVTTLALVVAREAVVEAGWTTGEMLDAAMIVGTSKGPVDAWLERSGKSAPAGESAPLFGLGETAAVVASELNIGGPRLTLSAACAGGLIALIRAAIMIRGSQVQRALVVASESSLHPLFMASFKRLGVLPPDGFGCRPFDQGRAGFVVSEAAAAICLEASAPKTSRKHPSIAIDRFAMGADATHLTGGDADGRTLRHVLKHVLDNGSFDLIHAHGTGTIANDPIELAAIESCVNEGIGNTPSLYSHKGALGHSLGAAGLVSIALNCLTHRHGVIPPNVQTRQPLETRRLGIHRDKQFREIRRSMAVAAGFGGAVAAVSIARV